jgi:hypothetical protein
VTIAADVLGKERVRFLPDPRQYLKPIVLSAKAAARLLVTTERAITRERYED